MTTGELSHRRCIKITRRSLAQQLPLQHRVMYEWACPMVRGRKCGTDRRSYGGQHELWREAAALIAVPILSLRPYWFFTTVIIAAIQLEAVGIRYFVFREIHSPSKKLKQTLISKYLRLTSSISMTSDSLSVLFGLWFWTLFSCVPYQTYFIVVPFYSSKHHEKKL